jgi:hypothetical protein
MFNWKQHKVEIALGVFAVVVIWYLKKMHAFYGEGAATGMMGMGMGMNALCPMGPMNDKKSFANCLNAGQDFASCGKCFGGGNKAEGGVVDTLNLENCINQGKTAMTCIDESTHGSGRAGVVNMGKGA